MCRQVRKGESELLQRSVHVVSTNIYFSKLRNTFLHTLPVYNFSVYKFLTEIFIPSNENFISDINKLNIQLLDLLKF